MTTIKTKNNNQYLLVSKGLWVRNFTKNIMPQDTNQLTRREDYQLLIENEITLRTMNLPDIGSETTTYAKCLIVSDGYRFNEIKSMLSDIPEDVCIIGVNRSLAKWQENTQLLRRKMNYFLVNNPYAECIKYIPQHRYRPRCVVSSRTNPLFVKKYNGTIYKYVPVSDGTFSGEAGKYFQIDDYRNPVCAAIGLAYRFRARKLALLCCDDAFSTTRPTAEQLPNGLWMYPQHKLSHSLIAGNLYWMTNNEENKVDVVDCSDGPIYDHVPYISPTKLVEFFNAS